MGSLVQRWQYHAAIRLRRRTTHRQGPDITPTPSSDPRAFLPGNPSFSSRAHTTTSVNRPNGNHHQCATFCPRGWKEEFCRERPAWRSVKSAMCAELRNGIAIWADKLNTSRRQSTSSIHIPSFSSFPSVQSIASRRGNRLTNVAPRTYEKLEYLDACGGGKYARPHRQVGSTLDTSRSPNDNQPRFENRLHGVYRAHSKKRPQ